MWKDVVNHLIENLIADLYSLLSAWHTCSATLSLRKVVTLKKVTAKENSIFYVTRLVTSTNLLLVLVTENCVCTFSIEIYNSTVSASYSTVKVSQGIDRQSSIQCIKKPHRFYPSSGKGEYERFNLICQFWKTNYPDHH